MLHSTLAGSAARVRAPETRAAGRGAEVPRTAAQHHIAGRGPSRKYLAPWETALDDPGFPPRPTPGSILDLDMVLEKCDFGTHKVIPTPRRPR